MAETSVDLSITGVAFIDSAYPDTNIHDIGTYSFSADADREQRLFIKFEAPPASIASKRLIRIYNPLLWDQGSTSGSFRTVAPYRSFDTNTITWNTRTGGVFIGDEAFLKTYPFRVYSLPLFESADWSTAYTKSTASAKLLEYGGYYIAPVAKSSVAVSESVGFSVAVYYDDSADVNSAVSPVNCITDGYLNPHVEQTFSWEFLPVGNYARVGPVSQTSATLNWRAGTSGTFNTISPASISDQYVTVPANTFPANTTIQWLITAVDDTNYSSQTALYTVSTADSAAVATPLNPAGTVEDGSGPIVFRWNVTNDSGSTHTASQIQVYSGTTLKTSATVSGSGTEYTLAADTLDAGTNRWRVRAANSDGTYGDWSEYAEFIVVAAPGAPTVTVSGKSWGTLSWQCSGQQAYRITLNGESYGPYFGTEQSWSWPTPLEGNLNVTATVEIQGSFGLWSQPGSTSWYTGPVTTGYITVSAEFGTDAELSWTDSATAAQINLPYYVWRDGVLIGKTNNMQFRDRFVLGQHSYRVTRRRNDNQTNASNIVTGTLKSCETQIAAFEGGDWTALELNAESYGLQSFSWSRTAIARHVVGASYPVLETSPFEDGAGSYSVAFRTPQEAAALESLRGKLVILKSRGGQVLIGPLTSLQKSMGDFYLSYTFTVQRVHWEDFIDDT